MSVVGSSVRARVGRGLGAGGLRGFVRHYLEMVVAMLVGMVVLAPLWDVAARALDAPWLVDRADLGVVAMALDMTVGMVAWMAYRRHSARSVVEMSAAMCLPFLVLLAPMRAGLLSEHDVHGLGHVLMLVAMALVMLLRPDGHAHGSAAGAGRA